MEEAKEVDLSSLEVEQPGLKDLYQVMSDLKVEVLGKCATKDTVKDLQQQFDELKEEPREAVLDPELMSEIQTTLAQMQAFPS